ncbi:MAG TPA: SPOR domain-containing protein [Deltaproteobacteria bacterium]|nr:SPOR domain-containing protein [Deltaproteobacteria bacterium]
MDFKIGKKTDENQSSGSGGSRQAILLVVLLVLAGAAGYLYFFTDMINPQPAPQPVAPPPPQAIKQPLPPREGDLAQGPAVPGDKQPAAAAQPATPVAPAAKAPAALVPAAVQKPAKQAQPAPVAKAGPVKPQPVAADAKAKKAPTAAKTAGAPAYTKSAKAVSKPSRKAAAAKAKAKAKADSGLWTVLVGSYVIESNMSADMVKVKKAGFEPSIKPGIRKKTTMNRLMLAEYGDKGAANSELQKLKRHTSDAFIIGHGSKHTVYAGSYLLDSRAKSEKERLAAAGYALSVRRVEVSIPSKKLTTGVFSDRKSAEAALKKLKAVGLKASLVRQ